MVTGIDSWWLVANTKFSYCTLQYEIPFCLFLLFLDPRETISSSSGRRYVRANDIELQQRTCAGRGANSFTMACVLENEFNEVIQLTRR